ncbi:aliphatic sulfonate ABC transporter substrate-binding protein [Roseomonas sp. NAR14]|uniref:Putative aliphatic sulfonates-binding protein n=1 Tax=Roseomonas acroporae TaxID=2937791 RepID=A0A9X1Y5B2_9PROT|nr:aliphatic sulfonate ABC transporter substrate-binding protein [Roseomonas acroporae]MCK8783578.1 aliphatic sulfonate ABC transporter substrate-binding protein [Roseomonas acroporae]
MTTRRTLLAALGAGLALPAIRPTRADGARELRVGFQKTSVLLVAKVRGALEERFRAQGIAVRWNEFSFGPPLLEALNVGSIDFGYTGDAPPIFAQAARANLLYVGAIPSRGDNQAILVPEGSTVQSVAELKGKRLAYARGSSAHSMAVAAVQQAGLQWRDIVPAELAPADAAAAFQRGSVDAWSIWDPYYAIAEAGRGVRVLRSGKEIERQNSFFLGNRTFTEKNPRLIAETLDELAKVADWAGANREEVSRLQAEGTGIPVEAVRRAIARTEFGIGPVTDAVVTQQQKVADRFRELNLIPRSVTVRDAVWQRPAI